MDNRVDFVETWLTEMPYASGPVNAYNEFVHNLKDRLSDGSKINILQSGLHTVGGQVSYYWYEDNGVITLGTELYKRDQGLVINITGKNPDYTGKPPYASDLYNEILNLTHRSIRLFSDAQLSDDGLKIWKKLFNLGNKVSIYDKTNPGNTFKTFNDIEELESYMGTDFNKFTKFQYVLSEYGECLAETRSNFNTRRYRELSGLL